MDICASICFCHKRIFLLPVSPFIGIKKVSNKTKKILFEAFLFLTNIVDNSFVESMNNIFIFIHESIANFLS